MKKIFFIVKSLLKIIFINYFHIVGLIILFIILENYIIGYFVIGLINYVDKKIINLDNENLMNLSIKNRIKTELLLFLVWPFNVIGDIYLTVYESSKINKGIDKLLIKKAKKGDPKSQYRLGIQYALKNENELAYIWCKKSAKQGYTIAQFNLGMMYYVGQGTIVDKKSAIIWVKKAAKKGHPKAQYNLGVFYTNKEGIKKNKEKAFKWMKKSAENDYVEAQYNLGIFYFYGIGVDKDFKKAKYWTKKSYNNPDCDYDLKNTIEKFWEENNLKDY